MSYGLYDGDWQFYKQVPFFNLELMKLSTYYKHKHQIVSLMPTFEPNKYTNVIVRQDFYNSFGYSSTYKNVTYGGRAFNGEKYKPLPLEIEVMQPDIQLYERIRDQLVDSESLKSSFDTMRRAIHMRLSLDGKTIWPNFERQISGDNNSFGLIFHDYDLGSIENSYDVIIDLLNEFPGFSSGRRVGMKFPVQTDTINDFIKWGELLPLNKYFSMQYNGIIQPDDYESLIDLRKRSASFTQTTWNITRGLTYEEFISIGIIRVFETILDLRSRNINLLLIYDKDFFKDIQWRDATQLICMFNNHIHERLHRKKFKDTIFKETMYSYCKQLIKSFILERFGWTVQRLRDTFNFVQENNYELFTRFYEYYGEKK